MRLPVALATIALLTLPARADSITSINGVTITTANEGSITATGTFGKAAITGGKNNLIGVSSIGATANVQILTEGVSAPTNNSIGVSSITATNKGSVTATGTFQGASINGNGSGNSMSVSAAGTSVNLSIVNR